MLEIAGGIILAVILIMFWPLIIPIAIVVFSLILIAFFILWAILMLISNSIIFFILHLLGKTKGTYTETVAHEFGKKVVNIKKTYGNKCINAEYHEVTPIPPDDENNSFHKKE